MPPRTRLPDLPAHLDRWVAEGLIAPEQAQRILDAELAADPPPRQATSLVTEALGYVGGVLVLVAAAILTGNLWSDLGLGGQLAVALGASALLLGAGAALPADAATAASRLRAVCWLLAVGAVAGATALVGADVLGLRDDAVALLTTATAAAVAAVLWWRHRTVLQQVAFVAALAATAAAAAVLLPGGDGAELGLAVWGVGAAWALLGLGAVVPDPRAAVVLGGVAVVVGALIAADEGWGTVLAVLTAVALVGAGVVLRDLLLLALGAVAVLFTVPSVVSRWFPDTLTVPFALLAVGVLLVAGALWTARRGARGSARERTGPPRRVAVALSGAVALGVACAVVVLGFAPGP